MKALNPSIELLLLIAVIMTLLVILSQKIKRYEKTILSIAWVIYIGLILAMTIPPIFITSKKMTFGEMMVYSRPWNLMPFSLIPQQFMNMMAGQSGAIRQFLGNIILFIPAGFLPPMIFPSMRRWYGAIVPGFLWSLFIELSQLILHLANMGNRSFDTDDLILNTLGALIGFILFKSFFAKRKRRRKRS